MKSKFVLFILLFIPFLGFSQDIDSNFLEMSFEDLLNMEVTTVSKTAEKQSDAPGIISVITKDELNRFGGTTLKDVLERVPGLIGSGDNYSDRSTIAVRGDQIKGNSGHVLLLINGRPVREIQYGGSSSEMYETFPVNIIERIEVIRGPGSVLYGSDAFSGVINVITKESEKNSLSVSALGGNGGAYGSSLEATIKAGDLDIVLAGKYLNKATWETPYKALSNDGSEIVTSNASIPDEGLGTYMGVKYKGFSLMSTYNEWTNAHYIGEMAQSKWNKNFTNLGYSSNISDNWKMDLNITYVNANSDITSVVKTTSNNLVAELTNTINLTTKSNLVFGGLFNYINGQVIDLGSTQETILSDGSRSDYALYAQIDYRLLKSLKLIGGIQANKIENVKINFVSRAGLIWTPITRFNIKALYSEAFRAPSLNENNFNAAYLKGDSNLKPENISTIDIGISYQGEQALVGLNFFHSKQSNIINYNVAVSPPFVYANLDRVEFSGIEFETKYYINKSLYLNGSLLYQTNKRDSIENLTPIANLGTKAGISYVWDKGITVSLFDIYQGDLDDKFKGSINPDQGAYNLLHLHSNFNLNKLFNFSFKPGLSMFLNIDNVLDKQYFISDLGGISRDAIPKLPGRAIYLGFKIDL